MQYKIFYAINPTFQVGDLVVERLIKTHVYLATVEAQTLDDAWASMQGERWSPHGEACALIESKRLLHTSMSIGDVLQVDGGNWYQVAETGFVEVRSLRVSADQKRRAKEIARDAMDMSGVSPWENRSPGIAPYVFEGFSRAAKIIGLNGMVGVLWESWTPTKGFEGNSTFCYLQRIVIGGIRDGNIETFVGVWSLPIHGQSSRGRAKSLVDDLVRIRKGIKADRQMKRWWPYQVDFNFAERIEEG